MARIIQIERHGGPEVLQLVDVAVPAPAAGQALLRQTAIGLNYIDTYQRSGLYPLSLPSGMGGEGAGVVEAVGPGVTDIAPGDRVAYAGGPPGAYAERRVMPADRLVKLPDGIDDKVGAAIMLKGMTARYLLRQTYRVQPGDTILVHAAAGGVGQIMVQWAKHLGAVVIGTVGSDAKAELVRKLGCDHVIVYSRENFRDRVREITGGKGLPVVYDSIGKSTFMDSLDCLRPRGLMVSYGNASGPVDAFNLGILAQKGSLYVTRPTLFNHVAARADLLENAGELFAVIQSGKVRIAIDQTYPLAEAAQAHRDLEGRKTTGCTVLLP